MADIGTTPVSDFDAAVRLLSGGTNVAIYNDLGLPSIYVRRDKGLISDVIDGGPATTHYAFRVNGVEVPAFYMGKYLATVYKGRALSLPLQDPASRSNFTHFNNAKIWCEANGAGFHLPTIAEYSWIALLSLKNGTMPHGNNKNGYDTSYKFEKGIASYCGSKGQIYRTLTGSGPATWNDNWKPDGICDLNGNVNEWQGGYRTVDGEIQIFPDNDAAKQIDQTNGSTFWKAILQDGSLVDPGADGTLKWDCIDGNPKLNTLVTTVGTSMYASFWKLNAVDGVSVPDRLKALAMIPTIKSYLYDRDFVTMNNSGECITCRGGSYNEGNNTGVFSADCSNSRLSLRDTIGFRPAFIPGI